MMYGLCTTYLVDAEKLKNLGFPSAMLVNDKLKGSCKVIEKDVLVHVDSNFMDRRKRQVNLPFETGAKQYSRTNGVVFAPSQLCPLLSHSRRSTLSRDWPWPQKVPGDYE
jgi:hypothetical protein